MSSMEGNSEILFPDFFPAAPKQCLELSTTFFSCITKSSVKLNEEDSEAGKRGLQTCANQLKKYTECVSALGNKNGKWNKTYRVQEEYQLK